MAEEAVLPNVTSYSISIMVSPWHLAFHLLGNSPTIDVIAFSAALLALGGKLPSIGSWPGFAPETPTLAQWPRALVLFAQLGLLGLRADQAFMHQLASINRGSRGNRRVGSWQHAVHAVHSMTALALLQNVISYNSSIAAYGRGGHCKLAAMLLRQMMEARIRSNLFSYNSVMFAHQECNAWEVSMGLLAQASQVSLAPNAVSFTTVSCWMVALELLKTMHCRQLEKDSINCISFVTNCTQVSAWRWALALFQGGPVVSTEMCGAMITACEKQSCWRHALALLRSMRNPDMISFAAAIAACSHALRKAHRTREG
ncbi:unnamed protein product [Symbiodinium natans]|uniref:Pentatricopeptide repeat-containing protein n=1 Tax=Symbiodinium natans TaxID=878477 RepID=A0A812KXA8_9DINO|nr:unnamed protein product [Symbiodinium natans]